MPNILNIEMGNVNPLGTGRRYFRNPLILEAYDGPNVFRAAAEDRLPRVINRRFLSGSRIARVVSTHFREDFGLSMLDSLWGTDYMEVIGTENEWYVLSMRLSGDSLESVCSRDYRLGARSCYMIHYARGMSHIYRSVSEQPLIEACVTFRPSLLAQKLGIPRRELNSVLYPGEDIVNPWFTSCELTPEMERIIRELRSCSITEPTYRMHAEAQSLELVSLYLAQLQAQVKHGVKAPLSRDLHCLRQVRRYLEENFDREPKIDHLCAMVGFNRRKLTSSFKREFGKTIREYHQEVRMEIAKVLFREQGISVSLVAEKVGYAYPGNFAKAFQEYAGMPPREYARKREAESP